MTDPGAVWFIIPEPVLDALDEVADVELEPDWRDHPPDALLAAVARLDEALAEHCEEQGFKGDMSETMRRLVVELHARRDQRRFSSARVAHEVMEWGLQQAARTHAPLN